MRRKPCLTRINQAPAFNPKLKDAIVALKAENNPKNLNAVLNELVRSPLLAPANFDLQGQSAPTPGPDGRVQLPPNTKINLIMVNSPEGKHYYLGFSDWDAVHAWQKKPEQGRQVIMLRFDDFANMVSKNPDASGIVINPGENSLRLEKPLIESVKKQKDEIAKAPGPAARRCHPDQAGRQGYHRGTQRPAGRAGRPLSAKCWLRLPASALPTCRS